MRLVVCNAAARSNAPPCTCVSVGRRSLSLCKSTSSRIFSQHPAVALAALKCRIGAERAALQPIGYRLAAAEKRSSLTSGVAPGSIRPAPSASYFA